MPFGFFFHSSRSSSGERGKTETLPSLFSRKIVSGLSTQAKIERCGESLFAPQMPVTEHVADS